MLGTRANIWCRGPCISRLERSQFHRYELGPSRLAHDRAGEKCHFTW